MVFQQPGNARMVYRAQVKKMERWLEHRLYDRTLYILYSYKHVWIIGNVNKPEINTVFKNRLKLGILINLGVIDYTMTAKRISGKRTTSEMSAEHRFRKWAGCECPYCGGNLISRVETRKTEGGPVTGIHYKCLSEPQPGKERCAAENFFSNKKIIGGE